MFHRTNCQPPSTDAGFVSSRTGPVALLPLLPPLLMGQGLPCYFKCIARTGWSRKAYLWATPAPRPPEVPEPQETPMAHPALGGFLALHVCGVSSMQQVWC